MKKIHSDLVKGTTKHKLSPLAVSVLVLAALLFAICVWLFVTAAVNTFSPAGEYELISKNELFVIADEVSEESFEDEKSIDVVYESVNLADCVCTVTYTQEQWEAEGRKEFTGFVYSVAAEGTRPALAAGFESIPDRKELSSVFRGLYADANAKLYNAAMTLFFVAVALFIMAFQGRFFTMYERIWFVSIIVLAAVFAVIFPEEDVNGINGLFIMLLYLLDTFLNILCELLISKQSKWNFIVSVFVELTEIAMCIALSYRFATLASTLLFWLPCDIISFISWRRHPDREKEELTVVRTLSGWQEALIIAGIAVWTAGVGYLLTRIDIGTTLFGGNDTLKNIVCYLDACVSAVAVVNGVFILLRLREQWIAWFIDALLEAVINILSGQYVLLVLKAGYLTNSVYGYIKWTDYIKKSGAASPARPDGE